MLTKFIKIILLQYVYIRRTYQVMLLLHSLHWLWVPEWITFRLVVLMYRCLHGTAPAYVSGLF